MKFWRYRKPSVNNVLGITKMKKRALRASGVTAMRRPGRMPENYKRWALRKIGYESSMGRFFRHGLPRAGGCLWLMFIAVGAVGVAPAVLVTFLLKYF